MKKFFLVAALISSYAPFAQTVDTVGFPMQEVVITANKFAKRQAETGKVVTILDRTTLDRFEGRTVTEVLNAQSGVFIPGAQHNFGTNQELYLRGASAGKTLILIDGVPVYDASTISGAYDLNHLNISNVEKIEIVKGSLSTLYGSDAVAGVINIITRKSFPSPLTVYGTAAAGSFSTFKGALGIRGSAGITNYNVQYTDFRSKGISAAYDSSKSNSNSFERDKFRQQSLQANLGFNLSSKARLQLYGQFNRYKTDLDLASFIDELDYRVLNNNYVGGLTTNINYGKGNLVFNYNYNVLNRRYQNDSNYISPAAFATYEEQFYAGRSHFAEAYTRVELLSKLDLLVGVDYRRQNTDQRYYSESAFGPFETELSADSIFASQYSGFASLILRNEKGFNAEAGGRYNRHSTYGNNFTYTINPSYLFNNLKVFANWATAFKAPTLYQLYSTGKLIELDPETTRTIEGGLQYYFNGASWLRALYFNRDTKNGIDYNLASFQYFNYNRQQDAGFEVEGQYRWSRIGFTMNYTYVKGEVNSRNYVYDPGTFSYVDKGDTSFNNLFRRPAYLLNASLNFVPASGFDITLTGRYVGNRQEAVFGGSPVPLNSYYSMDLFLSWAPRQGLRFFADLKNITNQEYFDVLGYTPRKFNMMAGLTFDLSLK